MSAALELAPLVVIGDGDLVEVRASARKIRGWTAVQIDSSLEEAASSFELTMSLADPKLVPLRAGDDVEVWIGGDKVLTGFVDRANPVATREKVELKVTGRSKTADLCDCSAPVGARAGKKLSALLADLVADYGIAVVDEAGVGGVVVPALRPQAGETIFALLDRVGRERGFLVTDDAEGRLVLARAGTSPRTSTTPIVYGTPGVLEADAAWDLSERYSHYEVQGQIATDADVDAGVLGKAEDPAVTRFRRLIIKPDKPLDTAGARRWAAWEAATRAGKSFGGKYKLRGWRDDSGELWTKNVLVELVDERVDIFGAEMLVVSVRLSLDVTDGPVADVVLAPRAGYELPPTQTVTIGDAGAFAPESTAPDDEEGDDE